MRHEGRYDNRAFYTVYSADWEGQRDLLGVYIQSAEGAHRWGLVLQDLHRRGVLGNEAWGRASGEAFEVFKRIARWSYVAER